MYMINVVNVAKKLQQLALILVHFNFTFFHSVVLQLLYDTITCSLLLNWHLDCSTDW